MPSVLLIKMSSLGDVIHALPSVSDAQSSFGKELRLDWVVEEGFQAVPQWHPAVARVIPIGLRRWRKEMRWSSLEELTRYLGALRSAAYDVIIDAQGLLKSSLLGALPARGYSHGYDYSSAREGLATLCYQRRHAIPKKMHAVMRMRTLFAEALGYPVPTGAPDYGLTGPAGEAGRRSAVVLVPSSSKASKQWREASWIDLSRKVIEQGLEVEIVWGSAEERERAERISAGGGKVVDRMELDELRSFVAGAAGMVSVDTGISHVGAACGIPNVCLCVATDPVLSGAVGRRQLAIAAGQGTGSDEVWDALEGLMAAPASAPQ